MSLTRQQIYEFGEFRLQTGARLLVRNGQPVPLGSKAFEVLTCLVGHAGNVVTKETLLKSVWPESFVEEGNLSQQIFALRRALGDHGRYIVTVPGRGYQFTERVTAVDDLPAPSPAASGSFVLQRTRERTHIVIEDTSAPQAATIANTTSPREAGLDSSRAGIESSRNEPGVATTAVKWTGSAISTAIPAPARRHRIWPLAIASVLALGAVIVLVRETLRPPPNRRVVIAELNNLTQDPALDVVLRNALEIDLDQSPYIDVMSESETSSTLRRMNREPDTALTPAVAGEVCQRDNRDVLIAGSVASVGPDYLLTLEASNCESGKILAAAKAEVSRKDQILVALDRACGSLRNALGESSNSIEHFQVPIAQATTSSLEALRQYSIGENLLGSSGKEEIDALPFFQRAVELDPQFAMAQAAVATGYYSLGEYALASHYYQSAFDLSTQVSEKERLYIRAHYFADDKRDLRQGLRAYQMWAVTYPVDWGPWIDMAEEYAQLGQYPEAITSAEHALKLDASRGVIYAVLARAYMQMGRFAEARSTAERALALGKDSSMLHATLLEIAIAEKNQAAVEREVAWSRGKEGEWNFLDLEARVAAQQGRYNAATELFQAAYKAAIGENLPQKANGILLDQASAYLAAGLESNARDALQRVTQAGASSPEAEYLRTQMADNKAIRHSVLLYSGPDNRNSIDVSADSARVRARIALNHGKSDAAVADMQGITDYEFTDGYSDAIERADAYRMAGQVSEAADEYRKILDNTGVDPVSPLIPLARLGLARAESQAGRMKESTSDYQNLFTQWQDADSNLPILLAARKEYKSLTPPK